MGRYMSSYPPPENNAPEFNPSAYLSDDTSLSLAVGDARYLKLTGSVATGLQTLNGGVATATITNGGFTFTMPGSTGTLALVSQIPSSADYVDLVSNQSIGGNKTFNNDTAWNGVSTIGPTGTFTISSASAGASIAFGGLSNVTLDLPTTSGTIMCTAGNQTITGNQSLIGQFVSNRASSATLAASPIYINPSNTVMSGSSTYRWTYLAAPPTSGSSTGTACTFTIAGPPSTAATNNYSAQIIAGQTSIPSGTVAAPSLVFGNDNSTGLYSASSNVVNVAASGAIVGAFSSSGLAVTGAFSATGATTCNSSTNYPLARGYKGSSTAAAGVVTFQLTQTGVAFGSDSAGVFLVTMTLQSGDFATAHGLWTGIVERSAFAGGKCTGVTLSASNASFTSITTGGLLTITVTASTSAVYEFTALQICY